MLRDEISRPPFEVLPIPVGRVVVVLLSLNPTVEEFLHNSPLPRRVRAFVAGELLLEPIDEQMVAPGERQTPIGFVRSQNADKLMQRHVECADAGQSERLAHDGQAVAPDRCVTPDYDAFAFVAVLTEKIGSDVLEKGIGLTGEVRLRQLADTVRQAGRIEQGAQPFTLVTRYRASDRTRRC